MKEIFHFNSFHMVTCFDADLIFTFICQAFRHEIYIAHYNLRNFNDSYQARVCDRKGESGKKNTIYENKQEP